MIKKRDATNLLVQALVIQSAYCKPPKRNHEQTCQPTEQKIESYTSKQGNIKVNTNQSIKKQSKKSNTL